MPLLRWRQQSLLESSWIAGRQSARACSQVLGVVDGPAPHGWHFRWWGHQSQRAGCGQPLQGLPWSYLHSLPLRAGLATQAGWEVHLAQPWRYTPGQWFTFAVLTSSGSYDWECLSEVLGSSISVTAVTVPPPGLPYLPLNPAPLARARVGRGKREDDNKVPGVPSTKGKGKRKIFFSPHKLSS